jgi:hypothetical protein
MVGDAHLDAGSITLRRDGQGAAIIAPPGVEDGIVAGLNEGLFGVDDVLVGTPVGGQEAVHRQRHRADLGDVASGLKAQSVLSGLGMGSSGAGLGERH